MTATDLDAIRARLAAATPGPWSTTPHRFPPPLGDSVLVVAENGQDVPAITESQADADLIAHAPADLAHLLAEVERLTAERDEAEIHAERLIVERNAARAEVDRLFAQCNENLKLATSYSALLRNTEREADAARAALTALRDDVETLVGNHHVWIRREAVAAVLAKHPEEDA